MVTPRYLYLAAKAKHHGARYSLRLVIEARRHNVPVSTAFAICEQESGFQNIYGNDPTTSCYERTPANLLASSHLPVKGGPVTDVNYYHYTQRRHLGLQGVGPMQLTSRAEQDEAQHRGGCFEPKHNISVGLELVRNLYVQEGTWHRAFAAYNAGPGNLAAGEHYAKSVEALATRWHQRLA